MRKKHLFRYVFLTFSAIVFAADPTMKDVFVKGSEIFTVTSDGSARQLTKDGLRKSLPLWSKDGTRIAYIRSVASTVALSNLIVLDDQGNTVADLLFRPVDTSAEGGMRFVESIEWLSATKLAVSGSINPTTVESAVIDLSTGNEVENIFDDAGGAVFSPDGVHVAYIDGSPHFGSEENRHPALNVDMKRVYPKPGKRERFITSAAWSMDSMQVAVVAEDYSTKMRTLVVWRSDGTLALAPVGSLAGSAISLIWSRQGDLFLKFDGEYWRLRDGETVLAPATSEMAVTGVLSRSDDDRSAIEARVRQAGGKDGDLWCQRCALSVLPRRAAFN